MERKITAGSEELSEHLIPKRKYTVGGIAKKLGVSRQTVTAWCNGTSVPRSDHAAKLQEILGIHASAWEVHGRVYFLRRGETGPIKIGFSRDPKKRIASIQGSCAEPLDLLLLLVVDNKKKELEIHKKFKHLRLNGEWFEPAPDLLQWIQRLKIRETAQELSPVIEDLAEIVEPFEPPSPHGL